MSIGGTVFAAPTDKPIPVGEAKVTLIDLLPPQLWKSGEETPGGQHNLNHFCLAMEEGEFTAVLGRLAAAGVEIEAGPMTLSGARGDGTSVYLRDPDGNKVELRHY